jgi:hypothetical protein
VVLLLHFLALWHNALLLGRLSPKTFTTVNVPDLCNGSFVSLAACNIAFTSIGGENSGTTKKEKKITE